MQIAYSLFHNLSHHGEVENDPEVVQEKLGRGVRPAHYPYLRPRWPKLIPYLWPNLVEKPYALGPHVPGDMN